MDIPVVQLGGKVRKKSECRRMSDMETIRFVELYRDNECLWNYAHPNYKLKNRRNEAYRNLMVEMDMESVDEVKKKLKSIRDTYTAEKHKIIKSNRSYRTKLIWYPILDEFLSTCGGGIKKEVFELADSFADQGYGKETTQPMPKPPSPSPSLEAQTVAKRKRNSEPTKRAQQPDQSGRPPLQHGVADEFHYFGLSVASQLRSMSRLDAFILQDKIQRMMSAKRIEIERRKLTAENSATSDTEEVVIENAQMYTVVPDTYNNCSSNDSTRSYS